MSGGVNKFLLYLLRVHAGYGQADRQTDRQTKMRSQ